jgi:cell division protease FtsH
MTATQTRPSPAQEQPKDARAPKARTKKAPAARPAWRPGARVWLAASLLVLLAAMGGCLWYLAPRTVGTELSVDALAGLMAEGRVAEATFLDEDARVVGSYVADAWAGEPAMPPALAADPAAAPTGTGTFWVSYPKSDTTTGLLLQSLTAVGARVEVDSQPAKATVRLVATVLLPLMILANLFAFLFVGGRSGGALGELRSFGTLRRRGGQVEPPQVRFGDVAGADEAVAELREVVAYLTNPDRYATLGASPPKGVLLFGPPGCGKTLIARATAGEAGVPFFSVAGAEFVESLVGVGAARIRDLFANVRAQAPAIVFIDELDAAGRRRGGEGGGSDEREQTLNQLLVEMDGFDASAGIVVMAATNRPDILDPALLRPGRFDRHVTVDQPDLPGRLEILAVHTRGKPIGDDVDLGQVARQTPGFTGADLANVVNEAALLAAREERTTIATADLSEAIQRVVSGPQRRGRVLSEPERRRIAVHEAGHALVVTATAGPGRVHRLSVVSRGRGLGSTGVGADADAFLHTEDELRGHLAAAISGRAAEELVFGRPSTGSEADLELATELARDLVARHGMSERVGRIRLLARDADLYLGGSSGLEKLSERVHEQLDMEVRDLVEAAFERATEMLRVNRGRLDILVDELLEAETLEGPELARLLGGADAR